MRISTPQFVLRNASLFAWATAGLLLAAHLAGCSSDGVTQGPAQQGSAADGSGSLGMKITLPGGEMINNVSWVITGPNNASTVVQQGTLNVQGSLTINFLVGGLSAGTGYNIALAGTSSDGSVTCTGSAQFSVTARTTSAVTDLLQCNAVSSEAGSVQVTAPTYNCATAGSISALPAETSVGSSVPLTGTATAADPSAITYAWSAPSGTFSAPTAANTNFTCTVQGPVTVTLTVGDGPLPDGGTCSPALATTTVQLICD